MKGGLQACSVTDQFLEDTYGTLKKIAGYGYKYIESAGTMFTPALKTDMKELRKMMDELGIEHPSKHYCPYLTSDLDKEIERLHISAGNIWLWHPIFSQTGTRCSDAVRCTMKLGKSAGKMVSSSFIIIMRMNFRSSGINPLLSCWWKTRIRNL